MRRLAAVLVASLEIAEAHGQSASSTLRGLDQCFAETRMAEAACDQAGIDASIRLGCRLKAHTAEKRCLDSLFANKDEVRQLGDTPSKPHALVPPLPPAPEPALAPANRDDAAGGPSIAGGWLISETTSPRDFSPLFVAKLYALPPVAGNAPEMLVLRCRNLRTELTLGANGLWRALRGGEVEVAISPGQVTAPAMRWRLASDGRTASMPEDPVELVRALRVGRTFISVADGAGGNTSAIFELAGIDAVRARLASACRWTNATVESRGR
jgi:hypothetical protein